MGGMPMGPGMGGMGGPMGGMGYQHMGSPDSRRIPYTSKSLCLRRMFTARLRFFILPSSLGDPLEKEHHFLYRKQHLQMR